MKTQVLSLACCLVMIGALVGADDEPQKKGSPIPGFTASASARQRDIEDRMVNLLDQASTARQTAPRCCGA